MLPLLVLSAVAAASSAAPSADYYGPPAYDHRLPHDPRFAAHGHRLAHGLPNSYLPKQLAFGPCGNGLYKRADGKCVHPLVSKNIYLFNAPQYKHTYLPPKYIPDPKVHYNYVFVRTQDGLQGPKPIIAPPAKQKTMIYLLSKRPGVLGQDVIEVPSTPTQPEVFFVNYDDGDNPTLPGGIDLQTALNHAASPSQVIGDYSSVASNSHLGGFTGTHGAEFFGHSGNSIEIDSVGFGDHGSIGYGGFTDGYTGDFVRGDLGKSVFVSDRVSGGLDHSGPAFVAGGGLLEGDGLVGEYSEQVKDTVPADKKIEKEQ